MSTKNKTAINGLLIGAGGLFGLWALAALIGGLHRVNWHVTEFLRQGLIASGLIQPIHTLVEFYSHIKGVEYVICVVFFIAFPLFFKYVEKQKTHVTMSLEHDSNKGKSA